MLHGRDDHADLEYDRSHDLHGVGRLDWRQADIGQCDQRGAQRDDRFRADLHWTWRHGFSNGDGQRDCSRTDIEPECKPDSRYSRQCVAAHVVFRQCHRLYGHR